MLNGPATAEINSGPASTTTPNTQLTFGAPVTTGVTGAYLGAVLIEGVNDYTPGQGFPQGIKYLDLCAPAQPVVIGGLRAGDNGQKLILRNIGEHALILAQEHSGSEPAHRFSDSTTVYPGEQIVLAYYRLPNPRWTLEMKYARIDQ